MSNFIKELHRKKVIRSLINAPRDKKIDNIQEVKTIGVICRLDNEQNWNILHHFAKVAMMPDFITAPPAMSRRMSR